jgi:Cupin domain/Carboxypeptidase regulatory-like domain
MIKMLMAVAVVGVAVAGAGAGAQGTAREPAQKRSATAPRTTSARVTVRDQDGASLSGVRLLLSGGGTGEFTTGAAGTAIVPDLKDGVYRVRCEREGFITLEREFTLHGSTWNPVDIVLSTAPPPPPPPAAPEPQPAPVAVNTPSGPSITMSIPDFLDGNFIGREPLKQSVVACTPLETIRVLQIRETVARHVHDRVDEIVYVVAGEGAIRIGEDTTTVRPGSLVVVTHGSGHTFERRGKNPLIVVSTLVGSACESAKTAL